jgi:hypothetical protein
MIRKTTLLPRERTTAPALTLCRLARTATIPGIRLSLGGHAVCEIVRLNAEQLQPARLHLAVAPSHYSRGAECRRVMIGFPKAKRLRAANCLESQP